MLQLEECFQNAQKYTIFQLQIDRCVQFYSTILEEQHVFECSFIEKIFSNWFSCVVHRNHTTSRSRTVEFGFTWASTRRLFEVVVVSTSDEVQSGQERLLLSSVVPLMEAQWKFAEKSREREREPNWENFTCPRRENSMSSTCPSLWSVPHTCTPTKQRTDNLGLNCTENIIIIIATIWIQSPFRWNSPAIELKLLLVEEKKINHLRPGSVAIACAFDAERVIDLLLNGHANFTSWLVLVLLDRNSPVSQWFIPVGSKQVTISLASIWAKSNDFGSV